MGQYLRVLSARTDTVTTALTDPAATDSIRQICDNRPDARGIAVVFANRMAQGQTANPLHDVTVDQDNMKRALEALHFAVITETDIGRDAMQSLLTAVATYANYPHTYQRMVMVFSGHGTKGALCTHDGSVKIEEIKELFKPAACPKLFFIDACRGELVMSRDGATSALTDYIMAISTMPDYVSYNDPTYGGFWMSTLSRKLFEDKNIFEVLVEVNTALETLETKYPNMQQPALDSDALNTEVNLFREAG